eukprot:CAMPEP_0179175350 /NCGR_PEP_ID=MMETSP0796-20121207/86594_1 /TAXON_ID=73915 /ORGANISM="Pyrodinium bahamense, Strain pbaha01" /LENGTH=134 /DNA_ID=CAMNT_0020878677 /DNA_START=1863 /DNA_END=2264 /DNA_ORIENTATION=-
MPQFNRVEGNSLAGPLRQLAHSRIHLHKVPGQPVVPWTVGERVLLDFLGNLAKSLVDAKSELIRELPGLPADVHPARLQQTPLAVELQQDVAARGPSAHGQETVPRSERQELHQGAHQELTAQALARLCDLSKD